jgi:hypothetical protein
MQRTAWQNMQRTAWQNMQRTAWQNMQRTAWQNMQRTAWQMGADGRSATTQRPQRTWTAASLRQYRSMYDETNVYTCAAQRSWLCDSHRAQV